VRHWPWQALSIALVPGLFGTMLLWRIPESPRFLQTCGREQEAVAALRAIAKANGADCHGDDRRGLRQIQSADSTENFLVFRGLLGRRQRWRTLAILLLNFVMSLAYFGLCFAPVSALGSNIYMAQLGATVVEVPMLLLSAPLADRLGRRCSLTALLVVFMMSLVALGFLPVSMIWARWATVLAARGSGQAASTLRWVVNTENFPTPVRGTGLAVAGICGQLGGVFGPLVFALAPDPFLIIAVLVLPAVLCIWLLPETRGVKLT